MKDTELQSRLIKLGMPRDQASRTTAQIRDRIHPVAAVAAVQLREAVAINSHLAGLGLSGMDIDDGTLGALGGNLFKKIGQSLKKVVKTVAKVAAVIPGPWMIPAMAITAGAAVYDKKQAGKKAIAKAATASGMTTKDYKLAVAAENAASKANAAMLKANAMPPGKKKDKALAAAAKLAAKAATAATKAGVTLSAQVAAGTTVVPPAVAASAADVVAASLQAATASGGAGAVSTTPADFMQDQLAAQGMNFNSPAAQGVLNDVAAEGVEQTPAGPPADWIKPALIGAAALGALYLLTRKR
jgi:hypothetical protein